MYYIYILKNPITNLPFYIGVGKENRRSGIRRENSHSVEAIRFRAGKTTKCNRHKLNTILQILDSGHTVDIEIGNRYNDEKLAFCEEVRLIAYYGRRDKATGILTNLTDGGEGCVNQSDETRQKRSESRKGVPSPLSGIKYGPYSTERVETSREKKKLTKAALTEDEKQEQYKNRRDAQIGNIPWNKGKTKETDSRVAEYAAQKVGQARPDMIGNIPWNKGKTKETDVRLAELSEKQQGRTAPNKGQLSPNTGKTYEEIHGKEKAAELKEKRRVQKIEYWKNKRSMDPTS